MKQPKFSKPLKARILAGSKLSSLLRKLTGKLKQSHVQRLKAHKLRGRKNPEEQMVDSPPPPSQEDAVSSSSLPSTSTEEGQSQQDQGPVLSPNEQDSDAP